MNVRERLLEQLEQYRRNATAARDAAADAGIMYAARRLLQLEQRFRRNGSGWRISTVWQSGLLVVPAVGGKHNAARAAHLGRRHLPSWDGFEALLRVSGDLDAVARAIQHEFQRAVPELLSPRAIAWSVTLDPSPPSVRRA